MNVITPMQAGHSRIWRFVQFPLTRIVIATVSLIVAVLFLQTLAAVTHFKPHSASSMSLAALLTIAVLIAIYIAYVRLIERRPVTELGTKGAAPEFAAGFLLGGFLFCFIMLILWLVGVATIGKDAGWTALGVPLLSALELGVLQGIFFYGILFRIVEEGPGTWVALALTVVVFGAAHFSSPGASLISEATIGVEAGVLFAAVYVYTRRLWMVLGLFTAWNFTEEAVFGVTGPGHNGHGMLVSQFHGPEILTGGAAGPEVTIVAMLVCLTAALWFFLLAIRKGRIVDPFWRRAVAQRIEQ